MLNNASLNTYIQSWSRWLVCIFCTSLVFLHILAFIFDVVQSPEMFHSSMVLGSMCKGRESTPMESNTTLNSGCDPIMLFQKIERLDELTFSFRFPSEETKPSSFSVWNWRILGNLFLEVSFDDLVEDFGSENKLNESDSKNESLDTKEELIPIILIATLDLYPNIGNPERFVFETYIDEASNLTQSTNFLENSQRVADFEEEATLLCSLNKNNDLTSATNKSVYICTVTPLFDIHLVGNQTYIVTFGFRHLDNSTLTKIAPNQGQRSNFLIKPASVSGLSLNLMTENGKFHHGMLFLKCVSTPFVVMSLLLFCARMYLNDLYISIPDRLLITVGLAQLVQNFPIEIILYAFPDSPSLIYLKLMEDFGQIFLMLSMFLFWIVYTKDKLAKNEPWERNTRYYWKPIMFVCVFSVAAILHIIFTKEALFRNPFKINWQSESFQAKLSLVFTLAGMVTLTQIYLSMMIYRVLCDMSIMVIYQTSSLRGGVWRLKLVLSYCSAVSFLTVGHLLLKLALDLSLHWNPQFYIESMPSQFSFASAFFLGIQGIWNLHTISLLVMLSRGPRDFQEFAKPIKYIETESTDQVLHNLYAAPMPLSIRRRNSSLPRRPSSEDFLEATEFKHTGSIDYENQEEYYHSNTHSDMYESDGPDPGRSESSMASDPPIIDSPDMLESLRRETVHLWETDNRSEPLLERVYEDEDDDLQSLAEQACYGHQRSKILPASSRGYER